MLKYHENQTCEKLPMIVCPLLCQRKGSLLFVRGNKTLKNHFSSASHKDQRKALMKQLETNKGQEELDETVLCLLSEINMREKEKDYVRASLAEIIQCIRKKNEEKEN